MELNEIQDKIYNIAVDLDRYKKVTCGILLEGEEEKNAKRKPDYSKHARRMYYALVEYILPILKSLASLHNGIGEGTLLDNTTSVAEAIEWRYNDDTDTTATQ